LSHATSQKKKKREGYPPYNEKLAGGRALHTGKKGVRGTEGKVRVRENQNRSKVFLSIAGKRVQSRVRRGGKKILFRSAEDSSSLKKKRERYAQLSRERKETSFWSERPISLRRRVTQPIGKKEILNPRKESHDHHWEACRELPNQERTSLTATPPNAADLREGGEEFLR